MDFLCIPKATRFSKFQAKAIICSRNFRIAEAVIFRKFYNGLDYGLSCFTVARDVAFELSQLFNLALQGLLGNSAAYPVGNDTVLIKHECEGITAAGTHESVIAVTKVGVALDEQRILRKDNL